VLTYIITHYWNGYIY